MCKGFDENALVKIPALFHLMRLDYKYVSLKDSDGKFDSDIKIFRE